MCVMVLIDTLFDVISASIGAIAGVIFAFILNRKRNRQMSRETTISRQELAKLRSENERLLEQIKEKENIILKMQIQILGTEIKKKTKRK